MPKLNIFQAIENANPYGMAIEALIQAETEYLSGNYPEPVHERAEMTYKDDYGMWRITGRPGSFDSYEELERAYGPF